MKHTFNLFVTVLILVLSAGCIKKQDSSTASATADSSALPAAQANNQQARQGRANANRNAVGANAVPNNAVLKKLTQKYTQPIKPDLNKGVFISEIAKFLSLTPAKNTQLDDLIVKYKRKGQDFRFFGAFYNNNKPFAKDLSKIFTPLELEKFKHFHAYWFDRIPYPKPDMPLNLYYRMDLTKDQFVQVIDIYSKTSLAKARQGNAAITSGTAQIEALLNEDQKVIYKELISISNTLF